jgi:hypothetical protein
MATGALEAVDVGPAVGNIIRLEIDRRAVMLRRSVVVMAVGEQEKAGGEMRVGVFRAVLHPSQQMIGRLPPYRPE